MTIMVGNIWCITPQRPSCVRRLSGWASCQDVGESDALIRLGLDALHVQSPTCGVFQPVTRVKSASRPEKALFTDTGFNEYRRYRWRLTVEHRSCPRTTPYRAFSRTAEMKVHKTKADR